MATRTMSTQATLSIRTMATQAFSASTSHATCLKDRPERESRILNAPHPRRAARQPLPAAPVEGRRLTGDEARLAPIADLEAAAAERPVREEPGTVWSPAVKRKSHSNGIMASRGKPGGGDEGAAAREVSPPPPPPPPPPEEAEAASPERLLQRRSSRSLTDAEEEERRELRLSLTASEADQALAAVAMATDVGQGEVEPSEGWPELVTPEKTGSIVLSI